MTYFPIANNIITKKNNIQLGPSIALSMLAETWWNPMTWYGEGAAKEKKEEEEKKERADHKAAAEAFAADNRDTEEGIASDPRSHELKKKEDPNSDTGPLADQQAAEDDFDAYSAVDPDTGEERRGSIKDEGGKLTLQNVGAWENSTKSAGENYTKDKGFIRAGTVNQKQSITNNSSGPSSDTMTRSFTLKPTSGQVRGAPTTPSGGAAATPSGGAAATPAGGAATGGGGSATGNAKTGDNNVGTITTTGKVGGNVTAQGMVTDIKVGGYGNKKQVETWSGELTTNRSKTVDGKTTIDNDKPKSTDSPGALMADNLSDDEAFASDDKAKEDRINIKKESDVKYAEQLDKEQAEATAAKEEKLERETKVDDDIKAAEAEQANKLLEKKKLADSAVYMKDMSLIK